jgi:hypothetical protein
MSIALVVTAGFGNGTLTGSVANITTRGYTIGEAVILAGNMMIASYQSKLMTPLSKDRDMITQTNIRKMVPK